MRTVACKLAGGRQADACACVPCRRCACCADLTRRLSEFETHADAPPQVVEWCGSDAVVMQWPALLLLVGPYGDHVSWSTADDDAVSARPGPSPSPRSSTHCSQGGRTAPCTAAERCVVVACVALLPACRQVVLAPEVDGLRLVSSARHELLRKVPDALSQVREWCTWRLCLRQSSRAAHTCPKPGGPIVLCPGPAPSCWACTAC